MVGTNDTLYAQIQRRLVESGEWDRIQILMAHKLNESGWVDDLRHKSKENARVMEVLSFRMLLEGVLPQVEASVPSSLKHEIVAVIKQYLDKQFEP